MSVIWHDYSLQRELALHAGIVAEIEAAAQAQGIDTLIVGAFARDLHLTHRFGIVTNRETEDVDFAFGVEDWERFETLRQALLGSGTFRESASVGHKLWYQNTLRVDIVPFGPVETEDRKIAWPPRGDIVMDVFGFREALSSAHEILLPGMVRGRLISLPALVLLKLVCWQDRHFREPGKDGHDVQLLLSTYLDAGNDSRLWDEFTDWTQNDEFQYELAGPRMLGHDIRGLLNQEGVDRVVAMLRPQVDVEAPGRLPNEMNPLDPDRALRLLVALTQGLVGD